MAIKRAFIIFALVLAAAGQAHAGCALTGSTNYTDYSGVMVLPVGTGTCAFEFSHCNITVYHYEASENGPSVVTSFRVHPSPGCSFSEVIPCMAISSCAWVATSQGYAYECTRACPY